jgi:cell division protein FtsB
MPNVTITIDEDTHRAARMIAAAQGSSLSALVKQFLVDLAQRDARFKALAAEEAAIRAEITDFDAAERLPRDEAHRGGT